ncbi:MAG: pyridoxal phosphate-dependent aminotransferase [Holophagales bacterium]|nr:pyridoxal phosphate-dependent aminotransferase [Holophagales bacterium]
MPLSRRARRLAESATARVHHLATELVADGHDIVDLSAGQPDFPTPPAAVTAAIAALHAGHTRYTAAAGLPDLRQAVAERYHRMFGSPWDAPHTVITVGAKAALFQLVQVLVDEGDQVVLPSPAWVSFEEQVRFAGGEPVAVAMSTEDGFAIRADPLIEALGERTRMVLVNSPCNPTGGLIEAGELRRLAFACAERGVVLVADETYERFVYDGARHSSGAALARELPETIVVVASFSKTWSMTGWRVGWALGPRSIISKVISLQSHTTSNPTSFAMHGALAALERCEAEVEEMLSAFGRRRRMVVEALGTLDGVLCPPPQGTFYAFPDVSARFRPGRQGSIEMAEHLLREGGVAVVPGVAFGNDDHIRLSFACSDVDLERALDRLGRHL